MIRRPPRSALFPGTPPFRSGSYSFVGARPSGEQGREGEHQPGQRAQWRPERADDRAHTACNADRKSTRELQSLAYLVCRLLLEKKKKVSSRLRNVLLRLVHA